LGRKKFVRKKRDNGGGEETIQLKPTLANHTSDEEGREGSGERQGILVFSPKRKHDGERRAVR